MRLQKLASQNNIFTVNENAANGTVIGTIISSDVDAGDTRTFSLTNNAGGRFAINPTNGLITVANGGLLDFEANSSHAITVQVLDGGGLTYQENFTIELLNLNDAPTISVPLTEVVTSPNQAITFLCGK